MLWFRSHRRFQEQLSAYIDAELPEKDALALDAHVQSCEACSRELDELRLASAALQELPEVDVPRSFALSPADVARPVPQTAVRSVNAGLRLTGAGLAAALAVLLVLDTGGIVGGGDEGGSTRDEQMSLLAPMGADGDQALESTDALPEIPDVKSGSADAYLATESPVPELRTPVGSPAGGAGSAGVGTGGGVDSAGAPSGEPTGTPFAAGVGGPPAGVESPAVATETEMAAGGEGSTAQAPLPNERADGTDLDATPTPTATPSPSQLPADAAAALGLNGLEEQYDGTLSTLDANADSDDGPSALLVTEIVLAALLGASIVGVAVATYAERRRR